MSEFIIEEAERASGWMRIALAGASNSGKTWSGLLLAKGIVEGLIAAGKLSGPVNGKIGVICTERGSAKKYAHLVSFGVIVLDPPYSPERYIRAAQTLIAAGRKLIMMDQLSHAWSGKGGVLELANKAGSGTVFGHVSELQNKFIEDLLALQVHLILTMRSKTEWVLEDYVDRHGNPKKRPKRIGMAPVQRQGSEYEWDTLINLDTDTNLATTLKDRLQVLPRNEQYMITEHHGRQFVDWLLSGKPMEPEEEELPATDRAQAIVEAGEQLMANAPTIPDRGRIFHEHKNMLMELLGELSQEQVDGYRAALRGCYDRLAKEQPNLATKGVPGTFLSPQDVDQIQQLLEKGRIQTHELLGDFGVSRLSLLPEGEYAKVIGWIIERAGNNGVEIARPARYQAPPEQKRPTAQDMIDQRVQKKNGASLFADMKDDIP